MEELGQEDLIQIIREVLAGLGILSGIVITIVSAVRSARKDQFDESQQIKKQKGEDDEREVDLTERLQKLSADLLKQMEDRMTLFQSTIADLKRENQVLREAGIRLIKGIEDSLRARKNSSAEGANCQACFSGDQALLKEVLAVRDLFIKEQEQNGNT